jgi:hypothetical protein
MECGQWIGQVSTTVLGNLRRSAMLEERNAIARTVISLSILIGRVKFFPILKNFFCDDFFKESQNNLINLRIKNLKFFFHPTDSF